MLPFIAGGIALIATGYGIGKLFEDDHKESVDNKNTNSEVQKAIETTCFYPKDHANQNSESDLLNVMERFEDRKSNLYETTLKDLQIAFNEIKNLTNDSDILVCELNYNHYDSITVNEDVEKRVDEYITILENTNNFISTKLDKLDELIIKSGDFNSYSDEGKELVYELIDLNNTVVKAIQSKITLDGEVVTRDVKRAFGKIEIILK